MVNVGSVHEDEDQLGLAHLLEHMAFNGSRNFPGQAMVGTLEALGMAFGHHTNASTSTDVTVYKLQVPTDDPTALDTGFQVLQDWSCALTLEDTAIERERGVVLEEWRRSRGAAGRIRDALWTSLWEGSRYANRQPIGTEQSLRGFDPAALRRLYRDWYHPARMAVIAVGDFEIPDIQSRIEAAFGSLDSSSPPPQEPDLARPKSGDKVLVMADPEITASSVSVQILRPDREDPSIRGYREKVIQGLSQGIWQERCEAWTLAENPLLLRCGGGNHRMNPGFQLEYASCTTEDERLLAGLETLLVELERFRRHGVTPSELSRRKRATLSRFEGLNNRRHDTESATLTRELVRAASNSESVPGIAAEFALIQELLPGIDLAEVNAATAAWLAPGHRQYTVQLPAREELAIPTSDQVLDIAARVVDQEVDAPDDEAANGPLVETCPPPGSVVARREIPELGVHIWRLSNGVQVWLKPTDFKPDQVLVRAYAPGGLATGPASLHAAVASAAGIRRRSGLGSWRPAALVRRLQGTRLSFRPTIDRHSEGITGSASPAFLEPLLQLCWLNFTAPRFEASALDSWRQSTRAAIRNRSNHPESALKDAYCRLMWKDHIQFRTWNLDQLDQLDLAASERFYRDRFADAARFTWFFVGDFDPTALEPLLTRTLAALPSDSGHGERGDDGARRSPGALEETVYAGLEPKARLRWRFHGPFENPVESRVVIYALRDVIDVLLREEIRQQRGATYDIAVGAQTSALLQEYTFTVDFSCDPTRMAELEQATGDVLRRVQEDGIPSAIVQAEQAMNRRGHEVELRTNRYWRALLANAMATNEDPVDLLLGFPARNDALTPDSLQQAARRFLNFDRYVKVRLLPKEASEIPD